MERFRAIDPLDARLRSRAVRVALSVLDPRLVVRRPVLCAAAAAAILSTLLFVWGQVAGGNPLSAFTGQVAAWLWLTTLVASLPEAIAMARGKALAHRLRSLRQETEAKRLVLPHDEVPGGAYETVPSRSLVVGDVVIAEAGDSIPADGEVIEGVAEVDESALTGESAPVLHESGGDRAAVLSGTRVLSNWLKIRVTAPAGASLGDQVSLVVETTPRHIVRHNIAFTLPLLGAAILVVLTMAAARLLPSAPTSLATAALVVALVAALLPTPAVALLSAIGVTGMNWLAEANIIAKSGAAVDAAGKVGTLVLDKTGTITFGGRAVAAFMPLPGIADRELAEAALLASLGDETSEGRSIVRLATSRYGLVGEPDRILGAVPFSAETRMSGARMRDGSEIYKGAVDAILAHAGSSETPQLKQIVDKIARSGGTPLVVCRDHRLLGVIHLKDTVRPGLAERFAQLRRMRIRTVMLTGDNPLTAATVAAEAGVDDFVAEAGPEAKLELIRREQEAGRLVAMCGDGTNDAPALARADLGVALGLGTVAARDAASMIDLDSDPMKLMEVIRIGRELAVARASLITFSAAFELTRYLVILLALLGAADPRLRWPDLLGQAKPESVVLSAIVLNAIVILIALPWQLRLARHPPLGPAAALWRNILLLAPAGALTAIVGLRILDAGILALGLV